MPTELERAKLERARRAVGNRTISEAMGQVRAVIGVGTLPVGEDTAQRALDKFGQGEWPTADELQALDVVFRFLRPAVRSSAGTLGELPEYSGADPEFQSAWPAFSDAATQWLSSIGRIDDRSRGHIGTGFLIASDIVATNEHVLDVLSIGSHHLVDGSATIQFGWEYRTPNAAEASAIVDVIGFDEGRDLALLRLCSALDRPCLPLRDTPPAVDEKIVVVGYPGLGPGARPLHLSVFDGDLGVKRASPGEVVAIEGTVFRHDCSTLEGSSGSPVFTLADPAVIGVHYGSQSLYTNRAVETAQLEGLLSETAG